MGNDPFDIFGNRPLRLAIGSVAGVLALALAFLVGKDMASMVFPLQGAATAVRPAPGARPTVAPAPAASAPSPADDPFVVKSVLPIKEPIRFGQYFWQPERGPASGPLVITVDLAARVLSVFRDGHEIGASAILKGYSEKPTPLGVFPIKLKDAHHKSSIYDNAPMPYTMRLTEDGVSIHGTKVEKGYATNGCVGIPTPFAKLVFEAAKLGDRVIITDGKQMKLGDPILAE